MIYGVLAGDFPRLVARSLLALPPSNTAGRRGCQFPAAGAGHSASCGGYREETSCISSCICLLCRYLEQSPHSLQVPTIAGTQRGQAHPHLNIFPTASSRHRGSSPVGICLTALLFRGPRRQAGSPRTCPQTSIYHGIKHMSKKPNITSTPTRTACSRLHRPCPSHHLQPRPSSTLSRFSRPETCMRLNYTPQSTQQASCYRLNLPVQQRRHEAVGVRSNRGFGHIDARTARNLPAASSCHVMPARWELGKRASSCTTRLN